MTSPSDDQHNDGDTPISIEQLRERHNRRLITRPSGKPRRSKRVSCLACVASKLGCDLERPSCSRCVSRDVDCCYVEGEQPPPRPRRPKRPPRRRRNVPPEEQGPPPMFPGLVYGADRASRRAANQAEEDAAHAAAVQEYDQMMQTGTWPEMSEPLSATSSAAHTFETDGTNHSTDSGSGFDFSLLDPLLEFGPERDSIRRGPPHDSLSSRPTDASSSIMDETVASAADSWQISPPNAARPSDTSQNGPLTPPASLSIDDKTLIQTLLSYPVMMLGQGEPPPFVHKLYPYVCGSSEVPASIAKALCCISAFAASVSGSRDFAYKLIDEEREQLLKTFMFSEGLRDTLASIHALIAYQIMTLFDNDPERVARSILYNQHLRMMTVKFARLHHTNLIYNQTIREMSWQKWVLFETIRRTVFVVHIINVLSARSAEQNRFFYEPLDEELIFNLPIPVNDNVFRADWDNISSSQVPGTTVPLRQWREEMEASSGRADQQIDDFMRMIYATSSGNDMNREGN